MMPIACPAGTGAVPLAFLGLDWAADGWPLAMAVLVGGACGLLGAVFLVRREALLGDAVSHSVLPGLALGLLASHAAGLDSAGGVFSASPAFLGMLAGALAAGVAAAGLIQALHRKTRIKPDTAIASVFPAFFAAGIIVIDWVATGAHFDAECVFFGALENIHSPSQILPTLGAAILVAATLTLFHKEISAASFDPLLARSLGLPVRAVDRLLVALLAATVVCAFEAVGAILVVALLVIPPATAVLLADRFTPVLLLSALFGAAAGALGCWFTALLEAAGFESARAPAMAVVAGGGFLAALCFAPRRGLLSQARRRLALRRRIVEENVLASLYRFERTGVEAAGAARIAGVLRYGPEVVRRALRRAVRHGEAEEVEAGRFRLTPEGRSRIEALVRAHRLWESYLHRELGAAEDHLHDAADEIEHFLQPSLIEELDQILERPPADPHGREIPGR